MSFLKKSVRMRRTAVKEGFDNLPSGICFAGDNGMIILCNKQMYKLCHMLTGRDLQHISELRLGLQSPGADVESIDPETLLFRFPDGLLWRFSESTITDEEGFTYTEIKAVDVTQLYYKSKELETENSALEEANARARRLYADMDEIVREKETLAMKMKVHDDIGQCLLASRKLLIEDAPADEYKKNCRRWEEALQIIRIADRSQYGTVSVSLENTLEELISSASEIGVTISIEGSLPENRRNAYMMIVAMRECLTNIVRHAEGTEMYVEIGTEKGEDRITITNNGRRPEKEITEGGGLSGLRHSMENMGGALRIESVPEFRLIALLPEKEDSL